jgi:tripartite-type tricarboxylate transporter receptor subunit TctC
MALPDYTSLQCAANSPPHVWFATPAAQLNLASNLHREAHHGGKERAMTTRRRLLAQAAILAAAALPWPVRAQAWPQKPVRVVVPFAPGGNTDGIARVIGQHLSERLGQPFLIENKGGGMGAIAAQDVARSAADGYTLFFPALPQIAIFPAMTKVMYDPVRDFAPISNVGTNPFVLVVHPSLPATTLPELVSYVRAQPGKLAYASGGPGTLSHLSVVLLAKRAGLDMVHVPYKGGAAAMTDLIAGHITIYFGNLSEIIPAARSSTLRALAVSGEKRVPQLPDVPTVAESGYPGFRTITWNGLMAPTGTPREIVARLAAEVALAAKQPNVIERLASYGVEPLGDTPEQFAATIAADILLWAEAVKISGAAIQ